jgi:hypothetical protein
VKAGATLIAYALVQRKGNRRLLFQCMAELFEMKRAGRKSDPASRKRLQTGLIPAKANLKGPRILE